MDSEIPELDSEIMKNLKISVKQCQNEYGPPDAYKHDAGPPRGAIFIANYRKFSATHIKTRVGSEKDVERLIALYTQMGYKLVKGIEDKTKQETMDEMRSFRDDSIHEEVDSMVLVIMSHGSNDNIFVTFDGQNVTSHEVYDIFSDRNCKALKGKPKMFIFQHCRGNIAHTKYQQLAIQSHHADTSQLRRVSRSQRQRKDKALSDIILLYSTLSGEVSVRGKKFGSPYIVQICRVFMEKAWQNELAVLMEEVQTGLNKYQGCEYKEIRKKKCMYFNPKPLQSNEPQEEVQTEINSDTETFESDFISSFEKLPEEELAAHSSVPKMNPINNKFVLLMNNLDGCQTDMEKLKELFTTLDYKVIGPFSNITHKNLKKVLKDFKEKDHDEEAFIVFYGDGFNDYLVTSDQCAIHFKDLQSEFSDINCPKLSGKPKIFITNLCYFGGYIQNEDADEMSDQVIPQVQAEADCDMFFLNVEMEGSHCENGSLLTEALCQVIMQNTSKKKLMEIMRSVSEKLDQLQEGREDAYICELQTIKFPSDFYMNPTKTQINLTQSQGSIPVPGSRTMRRRTQASHTQPSGALIKSDFALRMSTTSQRLSGIPGKRRSARIKSYQKTRVYSCLSPSPQTPPPN